MNSFEKEHWVSIAILFISIAGTGFLYFSGDTSAITQEALKKQDQEQQEIEKKPNNQQQKEKKEEIKLNKEKYVVQSGDTFADVTENFNIEYSEMLKIVSSSKKIYDFTQIKAGQPLFLYSNKEGEVSKMVYEKNSENKIVVEKDGSNYNTKKEKIEYKITTTTAEGSISSSLFAAGKKVGMSEALVLEFAEVFAWNIDFATQLKEGDKFKVIYEKRSRNGKEAGYGDILAAKFINNGNEYTAFLFEDKNGNKAYYNKNGESLVRQFLKAPLRYDRISSGYTHARFHPTLGKNMPHKAIDYAAAIGTPIRAVGDGVVTYANWKGCYGKYIDVRHNGTFQTQYAHLSRIAVSSGESVKQGDVIGYVGSTGCSTGPHLHYQIKKHGVKVNPLDVELPAGDPVPEDKKDEFKQVKEKYVDQLEI